MRKDVEAKGWYRVMKQKLYKHAFVIPFEAMEMLMVANGEKEPMFQIRAGTAGKKNKTYPTLNIVKEAAREQIEFQKG